MPAISSTAERNEPSFAFECLVKPLIFLTNCSEAARTSSSVTGGSKLKSVLIFLHIRVDLNVVKVQRIVTAPVRLVLSSALIFFPPLPDRCQEPSLVASHQLDK